MFTRMRLHGYTALLIVMILGLSLSGIGGAKAQEGPAADVMPTISVTGTGVVMTAPDAASVTVGVTTIKPTLAEAQSEATTTMEAVTAAILALGVEEKDIQTTNFSVNVMQSWDNSGMPTEITGFQVSIMVTVTVRNIDDLGKLLDDVVTAGANTIWGISFFVADPTEQATTARDLAVQDAETKATQLAESVGGKLGKVLFISEGYSPTTAVTYDGKGGGAAEAAAPIQGGSAMISVSVSVTYEIIYE